MLGGCCIGSLLGPSAVPVKLSTEVGWCEDNEVWWSEDYGIGWCKDSRVGWSEDCGVGWCKLGSSVCIFSAMDFNNKLLF